MHACVAAMNAPKAVPPSWEPKMWERDAWFGWEVRCCCLAAAKVGHEVKMWWEFGVGPHIRNCGGHSKRAGNGRCIPL